MLTFLRETAQIWWEIFFLPTHLKQRMDQLKKEDDALTQRATLLYGNRRFAPAFLLLALLHSLPLTTLIVVTEGTPQNWIFVAAGVLAAYGLATFSFSVGLIIPLLLTLVYGFDPATMQTILAEIQVQIPSVNELAIGLSVGSLGLILTTATGSWLWKRDGWRRWVARLVLVVGTTASVAGGTWFISTDLLLWTSILTAFITLTASLSDDDDGVVVGVGVVVDRKSVV
jgi:hypothetical protein